MIKPKGHPEAGLEFLSGGGEMAERIRRFDWSATPLGPLETWPQSLRTAVRILLGSRYQMFVWWGEELINLYNDAYASLLGRRHPEALGQPAEQIWHELWHVVGPESQIVMRDHRATWNDRVQLLMERNDYVEETYVTWSYSPLPDDAGEVGGVFGVCTEDTDRVLAERRLAALQQLTADLAGAQTAEDACALAAGTLGQHARDISFALLYLLEGENARLAGSVGVPPGIVGKVVPSDFALAESSEAAAFWSFDRALRGERVKLTNLARRAALPGGAWPEATQTAMVLPLDQGALERPSGFVVLGASPRLAFDEPYQAFVELVGAGIASAIVKARALEEERRRQAALAEIDRAKTVFFSNVSHEFRTPLTLMLGPLEDALAESLAPEQRTRLELLQRNALRLQKLVNTLLDFSRLEAGRMQASYEPTDLAALTVELASVFRSAIERAGMRLIVDCPPQDAPVYVDRDMVEKIVLNLLSNAFKFTHEGEITVTLRDAGNAVELGVADTGIGIAEEQLPRVFERFHRIPGVQARTFEGTGIGLALVHGLAKLHGGTVAVRSAPGQGSTFTVSFPKGKAHLPSERIAAPRELVSTALAPDHFLEEAVRWLPDDIVPAVDDAAVVADLRRAEAPAGPRPRIVWADDNADLRDYVRRLLAPLYEVEAVADGEAALAAVRRAPPDLILADGMMPGLDGFELLRTVRADRTLRAVPLILLTARAREESRLEGMAAGADDYVVKPFSARELLARIDSHLRLARQRREAELRQDFLLQLNDALRAPAGAREIQRVAMRFLGEHLAADRAFYAEFDPDGREYTIHDNYVRTGIAQRLGRFPTSVFPSLHRAFDGGEMLVITDVRRATLLTDPEIVAALAAGIQALIAVPLLKGGRLVAELAVQSSRPREWTPDEIASVQETAERTWAAVERAQAETALRESEERLRALADKLQEADRRKNDFLAMLGHELRNPLAAIRHGVMLLRSEKARAESKAAALPIVADQVAHMERLVDDLLDLTRIVQGRMQMRREPMAVQDALRQALEMVRSQAEAKGMAIAVDMPDTPLEIVGDRVRLTQVFMNILSNAVKYSGDSRRIEILATREDGDAVVRIRDHGIGISAELMPRIFDPFVQAAPGLTLQSGLGLGLAVVRQLMHLHGGEVEAFSDGGRQGSEFVLRIPLARSPAIHPQ